MTNETISQYTWIIFKEGDEMKARPINNHDHVLDTTTYLKIEEVEFPAINLPEGEIEGSELEIVDAYSTKWYNPLPIKVIRKKELPIVIDKLSPLEIAALKNSTFNGVKFDMAYNAFINGAKWQAQQSYTRDEVERMFKKLLERAVESSKKGMILSSFDGHKQSILNTPYKDLLK